MPSKELSDLEKMVKRLATFDYSKAVLDQHEENEEAPVKKVTKPFSPKPHQQNRPNTLNKKR